MAKSLLFFCALGLASAKSKPHILFLLADDLGWANIGYHRTGAQTDEKQGALEVQTPVIDQLVAEGVALDRHYAYRICGPARSALLSGRQAPHVLVKNVAVTAQNRADPVSGYAGIPRNMTGMGVKVKEGGYRTHYTGKWDAGMATPEHTPFGRGFETSFLYFQHANDYWNKKTGIQATGEITPCLNAFHDLMIENATYRGPYKGADLTDACKHSYEPTPSCYEEKMFEDHSLEIIKNHNASDVEHPLFLFHAFHLLHTPLQVPRYYYDQIEKDVISKGGKSFDSENRRLLMAMTKYMDDTIGNLTKALKAKGMWDNTLVVFTTDNGGPIYVPGSANNYPLRGGKYSDFDGGVRTATFISGGYVPAERRGKVHEGIVSVSDWYTIFSELAGVDPTDTQAEKANVWLKEKGLSQLAPVDGKKGQLEAIFSGSPGPRATEPLFLSGNALLDFPYKLVTGKQVYMVHTGPVFPNCSTISSVKAGKGPDFIDFAVLEKKIDLGDSHYWRGDCGEGCLFNVQEDPSESIDLSKKPEHADRLQKMIATLAEYNKTLFLPERGETHIQACYSAMLNGHGTFGPFVSIEGYYSDQPRMFEDLSSHEKLQMAIMGAVSLGPVKKVIQEVAPKIILKQLEKKGDVCCTEESCKIVEEVLGELDDLELVRNISQLDPARPGTAPALGAWAEVKSLVREVIGDACAQSSPSQRAGRNSTQKVHLLVTAVSHVFPRTFMEEGGCTSSWGLPLFVGRKTPAIPSFVSKYFGLPSEVASLVDPRLARPHTACAGVRVAVLHDSDEESDGGSLDPDDEHVSLGLGCGTVKLERLAEGKPSTEADHPPCSLSRGEWLLLSGLAGKPLLQASPLRTSGSCPEPRPKKTLPASLAEKLPRTQVLGARGGAGLAPQASRLKSHASWASYLPMRAPGVPGNQPRRAHPPSAAKASQPSGAGYPSAPVAPKVCEAELADKAVKKTGPKYRVLPGGSRPGVSRPGVGRPPEVKEILVLEFRSEPRVVPARRSQELRLHCPKGQKKAEFAPAKRFRQEDGAWALEREALAKS
ncbi:unnamed protein product [Effrenium voratum]|nr:unnamed protein product [Effrenium voratum]